MKVGIIGSGGREHAICETVKKSNKIDKIFCFPGNQSKIGSDFCNSRRACC